MQVGCQHSARHVREPWWFIGWDVLLHHRPAGSVCWNNHIWAKELCWCKTIPCICSSASMFHGHPLSPSKHLHMGVAVTQQHVWLLEVAPLESPHCPAQQAWKYDIIWSCWFASWRAADGRGGRLRPFGPYQNLQKCWALKSGSIEQHNDWKQTFIELWISEMLPSLNRSGSIDYTSGSIDKGHQSI